MKGLAPYVAMTTLLAAAFFSGSRIIFILASLVAGAHYLYSMRNALVEWPVVNILGVVGSSIGLFYFFGTVPVNVALAIDPDYLSTFMFNNYRDYDPSHLSLAAILVMLCTVPLLSFPIRWQPRRLCRMWTPEAFYGGEDGRIAASSVALALFCAFLLGLGVYLAATGQLAVDFNPVAAKAARLTTTIYFCVFIGTPALLPTLVYLASRSMRRGKPPLLPIMAALPVLFVLFIMGRRPFMAGVILAVVALVFFAGFRITRGRWTLMLVGGIGALLLISVPFLEARALGGGTQHVGASGLISQETIERGALQTRSSSVGYVTILRADLMGELSRVVNLMPSDGYWLGSGMVSQMAVLVPGAIWPDKPVFLATKMLIDERILERCGLRGTDIASTPVVYSFADFGWFAPIGLLFQVLIYLYVIDFLVLITRSYAFWVVGVFATLANVLQIDAFNFSGVLFYSAYTTFFAVLITALAVLGRIVQASATPGVAQRRIPRSGRPA